MIYSLGSIVRSLALLALAALPLRAQAPPVPSGPGGPTLPDGLAIDPRLSWRPTLSPTATTTVSASGRVQVWRSGSPVDVPTLGRVPLIVALETLANDAGEWVGIYGLQGAATIGRAKDTNETARPQGYSGISIVGLDDDPSSSGWARLPGFLIAQTIGIQRDISILHLTIDSWSDRPCQTIDGTAASYGNLYLEDVRALAISNGRKYQTAKGASCTKWFLKLHGAWRLHLLGFLLEDGVEPGDGLGGTNEHGVYDDGLTGDSEILDSTFTGCQISAFYEATRYQNRIRLPSGAWVERYAYGRLLIDNLYAHDCGILGSWAVNLCGGIQDVVVRNYHYRVNLDNPAGPIPKWAGGALQVYVDDKQYELDYSVPVNSNSVPIALGYSMEPPGGALPASPGADQMGLPSDGYGGARSLLIEGGTFEGSGIYPPLFNLRDVLRVSLVESVPGAAPFTVRGVGKTIAFGATGLSSQCGPAQAAGSPPGRIPAALGPGWNQQAVFATRRRPSAVFGSVRIAGTLVSPSDLDSWAGRL